MQQNGWHKVFVTLKQRGVDPLTEQERKLRRLPIQEIKTMEAVFQPRQMDDALESGKHLGELKRALQAKGELDPITVLKAGGEWLCLDGHHRLEAYRQAGGRRTHIPVRVFDGNLEDAFQLTIESNTPDKLNLTPDDKREAAWRMLLLGVFSYRQINQATTISKGTIHNMDKARTQVREGWPSLTVEEWSWRDVKALLNKGGEQRNEVWKEAKAREWAKQIARTFSGLPSEHPRIFAQALLAYDAGTAKAIAEEVQRLARMDEEEAEF